MQKYCNKCSLTKNLEDFYKDKYTKDGYCSSCKKCKNTLHNEWTKLQRRTNPEHNKRKKEITVFHRRKKLGVDQVRYKQMLDEQHENCAGCNKHYSSFKKSLAVDHCHKTGKVRGLLCDRCNLGLGYLKDSIETLERLLNYVKNNIE